MKGAKMVKEMREVMLKEGEKPVPLPWEKAEMLNSCPTKMVGPGIKVEGWSYWRITSHVAVVK